MRQYAVGLSASTVDEYPLGGGGSMKIPAGTPESF
jgi:hypothetical protein